MLHVLYGLEKHAQMQLTREPALYVSSLDENGAPNALAEHELCRVYVGRLEPLQFDVSRTREPKADAKQLREI